MDKCFYLCFNCRNLYKDAYKVEEYDTPTSPDKKCDECRKGYFIKLCRIKNKEKDE